MREPTSSLPISLGKDEQERGEKSLYCKSEGGAEKINLKGIFSMKPDQKTLEN